MAGFNMTGGPSQGPQQEIKEIQVLQENKSTFLNTSATLDRRLSSQYLLSKQQKTLVYTPEVRMYVATSDGMMLDLSQDVVNMNLSRVVDSVSSFSAQIANYQNRYKGLIGRMDRVVVFMKRIKWQQVFAGYITSVPVLQIYPGPMEVTGECTLKRLIHTYWDPGLQASVDLINNIVDQATGATGEDDDEDEDEDTGGSDTSTSDDPSTWTWIGRPVNPAKDDPNRPSDSLDSGASKVLKTLLTDVAKWDEDKIHIQSLPKKLQELLADKWNDKEEDYKAAAEEYITYMFGTGSVAGESVVGDGSGSASDIDAFLYAQRMVESNNNYKARSPYSSASGAYQYITSTWANYGGYSTAAAAPPHVQDARAKKDAMTQYNKFKDWEKVAAYHFYPAWANDKSKWNQAPGRGNPSVRTYVNKIMKYFKQKAKSANPAASGGSDSSSSTGESIAFTGGPAGENASNGDTKSGKEKVVNPLQPLPKPSSPFGYRNHPISGGRKLHAGVDYPAPGGTSIHAALSGTIKYSGWMGGYGNVIDISHGNGLVTRYAHQSKLIAKKGQSVKAGDVIGKVGSTGGSTGNHLHFEWRVNDKPENPVPHLGGAVDVSGSGEGMAFTGEATGEVDPLRRLFNFLDTYKVPSKAASLFEGEKARLNDEPLMATIQTITKSSMRSFMSAPNGDFIAFYPDYFGHYGTKATLTLDQVEMKNVYIQASDQNITTHVFTAGLIQDLNQFNNETWLQSLGVVTIEQDYIFKELLTLRDEKGEEIDAEDFLKKFGARPLSQQYPQIRTHEFEYFLAVQLFMQKWAAQYATRVELTFMPEIYPGMRIILQGLDVAVYVEAVTHNCDYTNGFTTSVTISSPSAVGSDTSSLPLPKGSL